MIDDEPPRRRRTTPADVTVRRAARSLVIPVLDLLGDWQVAAAKYEAIAQRSGGQLDSNARGAVEALLVQVSEAVQAFEASVAAAPEAVRVHNRVTDVRKVLVMVALRLERLLKGNTPQR
jgi:hypothetical protein